MDAEDFYHEMSAAVSAEPAKEITGLQILSYIHSNNLVELYPKFSIALWLMVTVPGTSKWREKFLTPRAHLTRLSTTVLQQRLSALTQISIEHEVTKSLDKDELIWTF